MSDDATPAKVRLTDGLGPLPERDARWALAAEVARGRMAGGWVLVDADLVLALDARLAELAALADVADAGRVLAWAQETPRRPANAAFTAGPERQAAYWIEWSEAKERERCAKLCEEVESQAWALWKTTADPIEQGRNIGAQHCADAIRA